MTENGLINAFHELIDLFAPGKDASDNLRESVNSDHIVSNYCFMMRIFKQNCP